MRRWRRSRRRCRSRSAASYASTGDRAFVSDDGRTTFALVYIPAKGGVDPGQEEARAAQAALAGVTVGGSPVEVTGLDALRASAGDNEGGGTGVLLGTLLAALGALLVLAFVFRSFMAFVPLLMALVAIPTTFLLVWPLASVTDVSVIVQFLVALIGLGIAIDYALLVVVRWREERQRPDVTNEAAVRNAMQHAGSAVVFSGTTVAISLLALLVAAGAVPAQHRHRRADDRAGQRRRRGHAAAGRAGDDRAAVRLASQPTRRAGQPWLVGLGAPGRAPPLGRGRRVDRRAGRAGGRGLEHPAREPARRLARDRRGLRASGLEKLEDSGIGTGPLSPFDALVRSGDPGAVAAGARARSTVSAARQHRPTGAATGRRSSS